jgi:hypothetical protein
MFVFYRGPATYLALIGFPLLSFGVQTTMSDRRVSSRSCLTTVAGVMILATSYALVPR